MTPRELYDKMQSGEDVSAQMSSVHAMFAKAILRRQAGSLAKERCVEKIAFTPENMEPWVAEITFGDGEISEEGQNTLAKMRQNAHRTDMIVEDESTQIMFYVYTAGGDAE